MNPNEYSGTIIKAVHAFANLFSIKPEKIFFECNQNHNQTPGHIVIVYQQVLFELSYIILIFTLFKLNYRYYMEFKNRFRNI